MVRENGKLVAIGEAARRLGVSVDTLRRWDAEGYLKPTVKTAAGYRFYSSTKLDFFLSDLVSTGFDWTEKNTQIPAQAYCERSSIFQARLDRFAKELFDMHGFAELAPLIVAICGEIGNNSFDHNLGNWPDMPGVYFAYDTAKRLVVLSDRGRGVLTTLRHVRPSLQTDEAALEVAFTEVVSGRAPEARGNGLKFVRRVVTNYPVHVAFQSGTAKLELEKNEKSLHIRRASPIQGCFAIIRF